MFEKIDKPQIESDGFGREFGETFTKDGNFGSEFASAFKKDEGWLGLADGFSTANRKGEQWDEKDNGDLKKNQEYRTGEYNYKYRTDDQGRIISAEADDLQHTKREERLPHNSETLEKQKGDDAGHLIGDRFGGSPDIDNLVSQEATVNRGEYKKMEDEWAEAVAKGEKVQVNIEVKYEDDKKRPSEIDVQYKIGDNDWEERRFKNQQGEAS